MQEPQDQYSALAQALIRYYLLISKLCERLPLPIGLPPLEGDEFDSELIVPALHRARSLIWEQPMQEETAATLATVLLDWITAHELLEMVDIVGPTEWRYDALTYSLDRVSTLSKVVIRAIL